MNSEIGDIPGEDKPVVLTPLDAPSGGGIRLQHMMFGVGVCAVVLWLAVIAGFWVLVPSLGLLVAAGVGVVVILLRRSLSQRQSLLWALAVAAERSMPLADAALAFSDQFGRSYRWRVQLLATHLNEGVPLPEALSRVPGALSREAEVLVRTGDSTGTLPRALREAASLRSSRDAAWGTTASRFAYLAGVLMAMQAVTVFILYFIIPKFEAIFKDFGVSLPGVTVFTIRVSHVFIRYFYIAAPLLFLAEVVLPVVILIGLFNSYALWWDVPAIDSLFRRRHSSLVMRALSLVVAGKRPIPRAIAALATDYPSG
ncbi:MAG: type II secretion system F family protein, partial [Planctomycetia bacterium]|nr:type II secretion system F family protein [Planctomycetia bacterium]